MTDETTEAEIIDAETGEIQPGNQLALRAPGAAIERRDLRNEATDSWTSVLYDVAELANRIAGTPFVPEAYRGSPAATTATILHGRELGLPPMTALAMTSPIKGTPSLKAEGMRALVQQAGHEIRIVESTEARCVMRGRRREDAGRDDAWTTVEWTRAQADRAGLTRRSASGKPSNWDMYPADMLVARATTRLCRLIFADVIHGMRSSEELQDMISTVEGPSAPAAAAPAPAQGVQRTRKSARKSTASPVRNEEAAAPAASGREAVDIPERGRPEPEASPEQQAATDAERERQQAELAKLAEQHRADKAEGNVAPLRPPSTREQQVSEQRETELEREAAGDNAEDIQDAEIVDDSPKISAAQRASLMGHFKRLDADDRTERLAISAYFAGLDRLDTTNDLTVTQAAKVLQALEKLRDRDALDQALSTDSLLGD